jgi:hypothetical protein
MRNLRRMHAVSFVAATLGWACSASALTIRIDYSIDDNVATGSKFFSTGNPQGASAGAQARAALNAAAAFYSSELNDTLSAIQAPTFTGQNGTVNWYWNLVFNNPQTALNEVKSNQVIAANEYVVYVGARNLPSGELGRGGPGGWELLPRDQNGSFTSQESNQIQQIHNQFINTLSTRGEASGFSRWGGVLSIDNNTDWHFNHTTSPPAAKSDFYSVALHELGHAIGFGAATEWNNFVSGTTFTGPESMATYSPSGPVPLASATDKSHWQLGLASKTMHSGANQTVLMSASIPPGSRRHLTNLDAAALVDIGWEINLPEPVPGDYNGNGIVDAADYSIWRNTLGSTTDLRANGNNSGASANIIDQADYTYWKTHFGQTSASGGGAFGVPEPVAILLLLAGGMSSFIVRPRWRSLAQRGRAPTSLRWADHKVETSR